MVFILQKLRHYQVVYALRLWLISYLIFLVWRDVMGAGISSGIDDCCDCDWNRSLEDHNLNYYIVMIFCPMNQFYWCSFWTWDWSLDVGIFRMYSNSDKYIVILYDCCANKIDNFQNIKNKTTLLIEQQFL